MLSQTGKGVVLSLTASSLFGLMYYYATLLGPLDGIEIFGWRILVTVPFLSLFILVGGYGRLLRDMLAAVRRGKGRMLPGLLLSSSLLGLQLWLFMWAPINGKALEVSLGYLLMPLVMVLCGRFVFKEKLRPFQKMAVLCAAMGVGYKVWLAGTVSLETMAVCLGFPAYFIVRKAIRTEHIGGLLIDMMLMIPVAAYILLESRNGISVLCEVPKLLALIPLVGAISAFSIACFVTAGRYLPFAVFGLLSYVEPILLVVVALLLGETITPREVPTYAGVFLAVLILAVGGWLDLRRSLHPEIAGAKAG